MPEIDESELFERALAQPAAERAAYLERACGGDAALRGRVEGLLRAHEAARSFLAGPAADLTRKTRPMEAIGDQLGPYKLLQKLGEGGCGVVYMAEQTEPVRRRVALKVIKLGMDTKEVVARFEAERQALAMMDHPNIARVFDAGETEMGRPYFVMELVRGLPITKFCDEQNLPTRERLGLFRDVCYAVQHAHQKGVIHRDLKPSNILVTLHDGRPVPKVIDFGIAKATAGRLTDNTLFTAFEQFIGTPAYMSPEQAELSGLDIDTRSDIYSLGVLLYELLTGRTPFDPKSLLSAGLDEIRRIIREVDPPRPSTRLSTLEDNDRATVAKRRGIAPADLSVLLRGDLDWIVMRCLEKDRRRRYETANDLAADILRHLENEPVAARPPSTAYRMQKWIARNKVAFAAGVIMATSLVGGLLVSTWAYLNERSAREFAINAALRQNRAADTNRSVQMRAAELSSQMRGAERKAQTAESSAKISAELAGIILGEMTRARDAESARVATSHGLSELAGRVAVDASTPAEAKHVELERIADALMLLDEFAGAERWFREALRLRRTLLGEVSPDTISLSRKLSDCLRRQGRVGAATQFESDRQRAELQFKSSQRGLQMLRQEAEKLAEAGDLAGAAAKLGEVVALDRRQRLPDLWLRHDLARLARLHFRAGDHAGAEKLARAAIAAEENARGVSVGATFGFLFESAFWWRSAAPDAHLTLGLVALTSEGTAKARAELAAAAAGFAPLQQLTSRDLELAAALADIGEHKTVASFLDAVRQRTVKLAQSRNFFMTIGGDPRGDQRFLLPARAFDADLQLEQWRQALSEKGVPAERRAGVPDATSAKLKPVSPIPSVASLAGPLPQRPPLPLRPQAAFSGMVLGWCALALVSAKAVRPVFGNSGRWWLITFCACRSLDLLLITRTMGAGGLPSPVLALALSFASWIALWKTVQSFSLRPTGGSSFLFWPVVVGGILSLVAIEAAIYFPAATNLLFAGIFGTGYLVAAIFIVAISLSIVMGVRLFSWSRSAILPRASRRWLLVASPLFAAHGFIVLLGPLIYDALSKPFAVLLLWIGALLPWLLVVGFSNAQDLASDGSPR